MESISNYIENIDRVEENESETLFDDDIVAINVKAGRLIRRLLRPDHRLLPAGGKDGFSPIINDVTYKFPLGSIDRSKSETEFLINPDVDKILVLSDDYALIITYCFGNSSFGEAITINTKPGTRTYWLLELVKTVPGTGIANIDEKQTLMRIRKIEIRDFIKQTHYETQSEYNERLSIFNYGLESLLRAIVDIKERYPVDFADLTVREIIMFGLSYGTYLSGDGKSKIMEAIEGMDEESIPLIIAAFQICEFNPNDAGILLDLLHSKNGELVRDVLKHYRSLCQNIELDEADLSRELSGIDEAKETMVSGYYVKSKKVAAKMIAEAMAVENGECFREFLTKTRKYLADEIYAGAILTEFLDIAFRQGYSIEEIEKLIRTQLINVVHVRGGGKIRDNSPDAMNKANNYISPEQFGCEDYKMICDSIDESLTEVDAVWRDYLKSNISKDLEDPNVYWVLYRTRNFSKNPTGEYAEESIAAIKIKHVVSGDHSSYYLGTMYVHGPQQQYGIGDHLQKEVVSIIKEKFESGLDPIYWGSVAVANPFMQRHIEKGGGIVTRIIREGYPGQMSKELFQVEWGHSSSKFQTKSLSKQKIRDLCDRGEFHYSAEHGGWDVEFFLLDTSEQFLDESLRFIKEKLSKGYVITRYFYDFVDGEPDLGKTFIVFEKSAAYTVKPQFSGYIDE